MNSNTISLISSLLNAETGIRIPSPGFRQWPFIGEEALRERLQANPKAARLSFMLTYCLQTEDEIHMKETTLKNRRGFMSSHALPSTGIGTHVVGTFEALILAGEEPSEAFEQAWESTIPVPTDKDGKVLTQLKADGNRWNTDQESLRFYAEHVGTRYSKATLVAVRNALMDADENLRKAARVISPKV